MSFVPLITIPYNLIGHCKQGLRKTLKKIKRYKLKQRLKIKVLKSIYSQYFTSGVGTCSTGIAVLLLVLALQLLLRRPLATNCKYKSKIKQYARECASLANSCHLALTPTELFVKARYS